MANKIRFKRGAKANLPALAVAEPGFCTDTGELFVGASGGNVQFPTKGYVDGELDKKVTTKPLPTLDGTGTDKTILQHIIDLTGATSRAQDKETGYFYATSVPDTPIPNDHSTGYYIRYQYIQGDDYTVTAVGMWSGIMSCRTLNTYGKVWQTAWRTMATTAPPKHLAVAFAPNVMPYSSEFYIQQDGTCVLTLSFGTGESPLPNNSTVVVLPEGARPTLVKEYPVFMRGFGMGTVGIHSSGEVVLYAETGSASTVIPQGIACFTGSISYRTR